MCAVKIDLSIYLSLMCLIYLLCTTEKIRKKKKHHEQTRADSNSPF